MAENGGPGRPAATLLVLCIVLGGMLLVGAPAVSGSNQETSAEPTLTTFTFVGDFKFWPFDMVFEVFDSNGESVLLVHQDDNTEDHQLVLAPGIYTVEARVEAGSLSVPIKTRAFDSQEYSHVTVEVRYVVQTEVISLAFIAYLGLSKIRRVFRPSIPTGTSKSSGKSTTKTIPPEIDPRPPRDEDENGGGGREGHSLEIKWNGQTIKEGTCCKLHITATTVLDEWTSSYKQGSNNYSLNKPNPWHKISTPEAENGEPTTKWSRMDDVLLPHYRDVGFLSNRHRQTDLKVGDNSAMVDVSIYGPHASILLRDNRVWKGSWASLADKQAMGPGGAFRKKPYWGWKKSTIQKIRSGYRPFITSKKGEPRGPSDPQTTTLSQVYHSIGPISGKSTATLDMKFETECGMEAKYDLQGRALASNAVYVESRRYMPQIDSGNVAFHVPSEWGGQGATFGNLSGEDPQRYLGGAGGTAWGDSEVTVNTQAKAPESFLKPRSTHAGAGGDAGGAGKFIEKKWPKKVSEYASFFLAKILSALDPTRGIISNFFELALLPINHVNVPLSGPKRIHAVSPAEDEGTTDEDGGFTMISRNEFKLAGNIAANYTEYHYGCIQGLQVAHAGRDAQYKIDIDVKFKPPKSGKDSVSPGLTGCPEGCNEEEVLLSLSPEPNESLWWKDTPKGNNWPFHKHDYSELRNIEFGPVRYGIGPDGEFNYPFSRYYEDDDVNERVWKDGEKPQRKRKYTGILLCSSGKYSVYCQEAVKVGEPVMWELNAKDWDTQLAVDQHHQKHHQTDSEKREREHEKLLDRLKPRKK